MNHAVPNSMRRLFLSLLVAGGCLASLGAHAEPATLLVAAGAGYKRPVEEIANGFEAGGKAHVERVYGHMGMVMTQARVSGKVAVVFGEQAVLEKDPNVRFEQLLPVGRGRLVLAWPKNRNYKGPQDLLAAGVERIGIPDMKQAIFGKAARESLTHAALFDRLEPRLITAPTVPQVAAWLQSGEIDAGFINLTEALGVLDKIGGYVELPQESYTPVNIAAGIVSGNSSPALPAFADYLRTPAVQEIFKRYGL
ncbi:MAG: molybdate ABC transporter substrate-binding protein [Candidatus Dactylopiibacterium carminicum]|uniref:Molybdate ABC transporter substrate-binding protein n=1 Tax=Candidatus Dactylopiibacterium carminicum TaxID=857335 RepID=A0A272EY51_9RHOO|nr:molybdate ABC transporter substrate-binding protein [Candidatus Dactylopiibacterium carminicum]KAF7600404.1 molybdate ABC transporter substrate-binding protein [Candidatus Dactylopiibacterium carminicum]PAS95025.1 MAG: molybdate ABC transporter substrate-binding protein [Candidatus Dactylopiibacterium carminicum]PAS97866.1 MAG: molybdate ABC transporter substrate-binding protein [Candidatus Dactylopiibacterium carminicum]PAT00405.1 MAG: molybdate ABC transporter substrate-binding protein [Ca